MSTNNSDELLTEFATACAPLEGKERLLLLTDERTGAQYCECHLPAKTLVPLGTTDLPLDPDETDFRANRDLVDDDAAFQRMKDDADYKRSFSNIVAEWKMDDSQTPLKIIGGQHRFQAIQAALQKGTNVHHGVKVYFSLDKLQRQDVLLISNTNIEISGDFIDRIHESGKGSQLLSWCHNAKLLPTDMQFTDSYVRSGPISVRMAKTFIANYYLGADLASADKDWNNDDTTPMMFKSGVENKAWDETQTKHPELWDDAALLTAGREYSGLIEAQRGAFALSPQDKKAKKRAKVDFPEKALNLAILAAWAFVAGALHKNPTRLQRHYDLKKSTSIDPLNAAALAKGKHQPTDPDNYRGLGTRTDPQERGRLAELFYLQAEDGRGINTAYVDSAIKKYHAKQSQLDAAKAIAKARAV